MLEQMRKAIDTLSQLSLAEPKAARATGDHAYCPLCGSQIFYAGEGYAYPDGLRQHLESSYNAHRGLYRENVRMKQESQELARRTG